MVFEEGERNGFGVFTMGPKSEAINGFLRENGISVENSVVVSGKDTLMYKRRRRSTMSSSEKQLLGDGKVSMDTASKVTDKTVKEPLDKAFDKSSSDQVSLARLNSDAFLNGSDECSHKSFRKLVLEQMYQSLNKSEGGIQQCIQNALKDGEERHNYLSETRWMFNRTQNAANGHSGVMPNRLLNESDHCKNTELCKRAFFDILISEKFSELCNLLFKNFREVKVDRILDVNFINSRMKEGAYERSPMRFLSDMQQVWTKLEKVGSEMVDLARSLSDKSKTYCKQSGGLAHSTFEDSKHESVMEGPDVLDKPKQTEACSIYRVCTCRNCGIKADVRNCLVCDSCEEMYHVSCIEPAVKEIPLKSWYCANCISKGIESPHENCVMCERLNATPTSPINGVDGILMNEDELEESSDCLEGVQPSKGGKACCKICRAEVKNGERFRTCGHSYCDQKYYHDKCLTNKQLGTYGPCWYCPSCLCRTCLTDKDDDKIVLCDCCDQAYHIYCMVPPLSSIPSGCWFCRKCDAELRLIHETKRAYENRQNKLKIKDAGGKGEYDKRKNIEVREDELDKSGGVDMLLDAAKTIEDGCIEEEGINENRHFRRCKKSTFHGL